MYPSGTASMESSVGSIDETDGGVETVGVVLEKEARGLRELGRKGIARAAAATLARDFAWA